MVEQSQTKAKRNKRRRALSLRIQNESANGWRVESQTDFDAVLVKTKPHIMRYLLLTAVTVGFYWMGGWLFYRPTRDIRRAAAVDEWGRVTVSDL